MSEGRFVPVDPPPNTKDRVFPKDGSKEIWVWQPDGDLIGTVIFVHGLFDNVRTCVKGKPFAAFNPEMKTNGVPLPEQFEKSGLKATFIIPEAEIHSDKSGVEVVWRDLRQLLQAADAAGPVVALSHSAGYRTVAWWLHDADLVHVSLIDSMYADLSKEYLAWLDRSDPGHPAHTIDLVGAGKWPRSYFEPMAKKYGAETWTEKSVSPRFAPTASVADPLQAKVLWVDVPGYNHMKLVGGSELIPALLKRAAAALRSASKGPQAAAQQAPRKPVVFEAKSGEDEAASHHVLENPLKSKLKDVPDLARMAALHDLVLKKGVGHQDAVKAVQGALGQLGGNVKATGTYDADTERAARDFQQRWNRQAGGQRKALSPDGRIGQQTILALDEALRDPAFASAGHTTPSPPPSAEHINKPAPAEPGKYPIDIDSAQRFSFAAGAAELSSGTHKNATRAGPHAPAGNYHRFAEAPKVGDPDDARRPNGKRTQLILDGSAWDRYSGPGGSPEAAGYGKGHSSVPVHPLLVEPLSAMLAALIGEGERIDDESMKRVLVRSGWRSVEEDGALFLAQLYSRIKEDKASHKPIGYGNLTFPTALEAEAKGNLRNSAAQRSFLQHLAEAPGWNAELANSLWEHARSTKAPGGASPHESGLVVDIDFPYVHVYVDEKTQETTTTVQWHNISRHNNAQARLSGAGMWLATHAPEFGFSSYDTSIEIWHQEWLNWKGTAADPAHHS